jgi:hypothetical protein
VAWTFTPSGFAFISFATKDGVDNRAAFVPLVVKALSDINSTPCGQGLLRGIAAAKVAASRNGYRVAIYPPNGQKWTNLCKAGNELNGRAGGSGTTAAVVWNPNIISTPQGERKASVGLAHELIHAYHYTNGLAISDYVNEELFTVGLIPYAVSDYTENKIRVEHNLPPRENYDPAPADQALAEFYKFINQ